MDKKIILSIDATSSSPKIEILSLNYSVLASQFIEQANFLSEKILPTIEELLQSVGSNKKDFAAVLVSPGPGSYTSLRISLTVANFIAFGLNIPVITERMQDLEKNFSNFALPKYGNEPVITKQKPRL